MAGLGPAAPSTDDEQRRKASEIGSPDSLRGQPEKGRPARPARGPPPDIKGVPLESGRHGRPRPASPKAARRLSQFSRGPGF